MAFKGCNGKYLSAQMINRCPYLLFKSDDLGDLTIGNHLSAKPERILHIISISLFEKWRLTKDDWICSDSNNFSLDDSYTFFWPLKVEDNLIALYSMCNKNFCRPITVGDDITSGLMADVPTIHASLSGLRTHQAPPNSSPGSIVPNTDIPTCQICNKKGHVAANCYQRHNQTSAPTS
ncbi:unnamed protein product [Prunus armeniaca]|uniref:Agglutinin domain-containing protein n=1 Tax=Prunus armeniaca TaxID=36596 RepID=A0A6J5WHG3_PRUAR|nr:unnamed protein product [Prunus armeniaca]